MGQRHASVDTGQEPPGEAVNQRLLSLFVICGARLNRSAIPKFGASAAVLTALAAARLVGA